MTYYAGFEPFAIRDHNEEVLREVRQAAPREAAAGEPPATASRRFALTFRRMLPLPRPR